MNVWTMGRAARLPLAVGFFVAAFLIAAASPAWAASMTVTTTDDDLSSPTGNGECSLREAILNSNANAVVQGDCPAAGSLGASAVDTIGFAPGVAGVITLEHGQLEIDTGSDGVTINGPGADVLSVSGNDASRVFKFEGGTNEISGMSIINGSADFGGGVSNAGNLKLTESVVSGNAASIIGGGGGIHNVGTGNLTLTESTVSDNEANFIGGGILNSGTMTVSRSTVSGNTANFGGGGVYSQTESISTANPSPARRTTITNSTISGNDAVNEGGGVSNNNGLTVIENSTITENEAQSNSGSGVASFGNGLTRTEASSSIIAGNTNTDVDFVFETLNSFLSNGHNLIGDGNATGAFTAAKRDQTGVTDPGLGLLAENGGPTMTHEVEAASPALDKGKNGEASLATDQRGESRTSVFPAVPNAIGGDGTDIGAFERQAPNPLGCTKFGTPGNDVLRGTPGRDVICGFGGNDTIRGLGGNDLIYAGAGNDTVYGGEGNDLVFGQQGSNLIFGEGGADRLRGGSGNDKLRGGLGNDDLRGGAGSDTLIGQAGADKHFGEAGNDTINARDGVRGNDFANGGAGNDRCLSDPRDRRVSCER